jgi:hypothetical protein
VLRYKFSLDAALVLHYFFKSGISERLVLSPLPFSVQLWWNGDALAARLKLYVELRFTFSKRHKRAVAVLEKQLFTVSNPVRWVKEQK